MISTSLCTSDLNGFEKTGLFLGEGLSKSTGTLALRGCRRAGSRCGRFIVVRFKSELKGMTISSHAVRMKIGLKAMAVQKMRKQSGQLMS